MLPFTLALSVVLEEWSCVVSRSVITDIPYFEAALRWRSMQGTGAGEKDEFHMIECYDLRGGESFVLPEIFGFYECRCLASRRRWTPTPLSVTTDYRLLVKVVRAAQYLLTDDLMEYVAGVLEVPTLALWEMSVKRMTDKLRSVMKVALFQKRTALNCFICGGSFRSDPPAVDVIAKLPCCDGDVHPACLVSARVHTFQRSCLVGLINLVPRL